jgi:hypothetical protein
MAQKIDIGDYVNLNLDQNDMATALNNLNNPNGSQVIDNLMEQYDGVMQQQPQMMQPQPQQLMQQPQMMQPQPQMMQQQPQMMQQQPQMVQQPIITTVFNKNNEEKNKILKDLDLDLSEKKPSVEITAATIDTKPTKKSLMLHMKETILVIFLYIIFGNDYINTYITKYVPYFNELPLVLFVIKVILVGLLYHIIRYFMN